MGFAAFGQSPVWGALFWASYAAWIATELVIAARDRRAARGTPTDRNSLRLLVLAFALGLGLAFWWGQRRRLGQIEAPVELVMAASLALIWGGIALRVWAVRTLGRFFRITVTVQDDHRLVDGGPYRRLRHPSYSGTLLTLAGVGAGIGNWISLGLVLAFPVLGYAWRIHVEEAALARRFGAAFEAYRRTRWALIPGVW